MDHSQYSDDYIRGILETTQTIAMVGASKKPDRASHRVMKFLQGEGYKVYPVNPYLVGETLLGETVYADLRAIGEQIDMVDVFRRSQFVAAIVDHAIEAGARIIWTQLDVRDEVAAKQAEEAGLQVVMNRCPMIELPRLGMTHQKIIYSS